VVHVQSLKMKMSHMILQLFVFEKYFDFLWSFTASAAAVSVIIFSYYVFIYNGLTIHSVLLYCSQISYMQRLYDVSFGL
jgi:hypothetical protein